MRVLALLLFCATAWAGPFTCAPKEYGGTGTYYTITRTTDGTERAWVCGGLSPDNTLNIGYISTLDSVSLPLVCLSGVAAINANAADLVDAANRLLLACSVTYPPGSPEDAAYQALRSASVKAIWAKWNADHPAAGPIYKVPFAGRIYTYKSPTQLGDDTGRKSVTGALCKALKTTIGNSVYWTLDGGSDTEVTYCVKVGG